MITQAAPRPAAGGWKRCSPSITSATASQEAAPPSSAGHTIPRADGSAGPAAAPGPDAPGPDAPGPDAPGPDAPGPEAPGQPGGPAAGRRTHAASGNSHSTVAPMKTSGRVTRVNTYGKPGSNAETIPAQAAGKDPTPNMLRIADRDRCRIPGDLPRPEAA